MAFGLRFDRNTKRIIAITLCLMLLFGAWSFRWEEIASETVEGVKTVCLTDRWTGQKWIKSTGVSDDGKLYDDVMTPYIPKEEISARGKGILAGPAGEKKKESIQTQIDEAITNKEKVSKGHTEYVRLYERYEKERHAKYIEPLLPPEDDFSYASALIRIRLTNVELFGNSEVPGKYDYIHSRIPEEIKQDNKAWKEYDDLQKEYSRQMSDINSWANEEAEKVLKAEAYASKKTATYIWFSHLGIVLAVAGILAIVSRKGTSGNAAASK